MNNLQNEERAKKYYTNYAEPFDFEYISVNRIAVSHITLHMYFSIFAIAVDQRSEIFDELREDLHFVHLNFISSYIVIIRTLVSFIIFIGSSLKILINI